MFQGRTLLIVTKHEKEKVIAPLLEKELGVNCVVSSNFDTDELGTFTGEIERKEDPIKTVRNKCLQAMEYSNCDLAVASEGSFGPHPTMFFSYADDEFVIFIDKKNNLEIIGRNLSLETNFNAKFVNCEKELHEFANNVGFPAHALILRKDKNDFSNIVKGITDSYDLDLAYQKLSGEDGKVYAETDMRALYNPTRMKVIEKATLDLVKQINSKCPNCKTPGFSVIEVKKGLPCEECHFPTKGTLSYIYSCKKCSFSKEEYFPNKVFVQSAEFCDICNP